MLAPSDVDLPGDNVIASKINCVKASQAGFRGMIGTFTELDRA